MVPQARLIHRPAPSRDAAGKSNASSAFISRKFCDILCSYEKRAERVTAPPKGDSAQPYA